MSEKRFRVGDDVTLTVERYKHGLPAKVVGFQGERIRIMYVVSGVEITVDPKEISHKQSAQA